MRPHFFLEDDAVVDGPDKHQGAASTTVYGLMPLPAMRLPGVVFFAPPLSPTPARYAAAQPVFFAPPLWRGLMNMRAVASS